MKEYLEKQADGSYKLVMRGIVGKDDDIEVPEGAEVATVCRNYIIFWKDEKYSFSVSEENKWCYKSCDNSRYFSLGEYMNKYGDVSIIWRREQDEPFLTPETTLNDQYAEIEQVRKHRHYFKDVSNIAEIDVYAVLKLFDVTDPCLQHIVKKALCAGKRGHKDMMEDLQNIADTAIRAVELNS